MAKGRAFADVTKVPDGFTFNLPNPSSSDEPFKGGLEIKKRLHALRWPLGDEALRVQPRTRGMDSATTLDEDPWPQMKPQAQLTL